MGILPLMSGLLLLAAYPPIGRSGLAWVALAPLLWAALHGGGPGGALQRHAGLRALLAWSFAGGLLWGAGLFYPLLFIQEGTAAERVGGAAIIALLMATILTLFAASAVATSQIAPAGRRPWLAPPLLASAWVCAEYAVRAVAAGFSSYLGVTQWQAPAMLALAAYGGIYGVTWLIVAANAVVVEAVVWLARVTGRRRLTLPKRRAAGVDARAGRMGLMSSLSRARWYLIAVGGATLIAVLAGGEVGPLRRLAATGVEGTARADQAVTTGLPSSPLHVVLVQPFIVPSEYRAAQTVATQQELWRTSFDLARHAVSAAHEGATLVIMPETMVHYAAWDDPLFRETVATFARSLHVYWLGGLPRSFDPGRDAGLGNPDPDRRDRNSAFLVDPKGMLRHVYDKVYVIPIAEKQFAPGRSVGVVDAGGHWIGAGICSDVVAPDHALATARAGAQSLHYIASLEHIGAIAQLEQAFVAFRAAEHRMYVTQTATTGFTLVADPAGRIVARADATGPGAVTFTIDARRSPTPYTRLGDWVPLIAGILALAGGLVRRRPRRGANPPLPQ